MRKNKLGLALVLLVVIASSFLVACKDKDSNLSLVEKLNRADRLHKEGKGSEAKELYKEIINAYGDSPESYLKLSSIYGEEGNFKEEEKTLLMGIEKTEYTNNLRVRLIDLYKNQYKDEKAARNQVLRLMEENLHSYKFELIMEEYEDYMYDGIFTNIIRVYKNNDHNDRLPIYLIGKTERNPSRENIDETLKVLERLDISQASPKVQARALGFYMRNGNLDEVTDIIKEMSLANKNGSLFGVYGHILSQYKEDYILEDILQVDVDKDGREENINLFTKKLDNGRLEYYIELQNSSTGEVYDTYLGESDYHILNLEVPLSVNPEEHILNLVQSNEDDMFQFIEIFKIEDKKIVKSI